MERLASLLEATTGAGDAVKAATAALEEEQAKPGFGPQLLALSAVVPAAGYSLPAATYLKNLVWANHLREDRNPEMAAAERAVVRTQLLDILMRTEGAVLRQLAETLRVLVVQDFRDADRWPELVPTVRSAIQHSNLMGGMHTSPIKTYNALVAVRTLTKPFQYFQKPTEAHEAVPPQLEAITSQLLEPLQSIYQTLVQQAVASHAAGASEHDALLLLLLKSFHQTIRSHLPVSLLPHLSTWLHGVLALLALPVVPQRELEPAHLVRLKLIKRALQIYAAMVARHRKQADKYLQQMVTAAVTTVTAAVGKQDLHPVQERIVSLALDLQASVLETGPGWRLLAPHFPSLLSQAIFPALTLQQQDVMEWQEDPVAYVSKNLPDDMDDVSGFRDDLFSPRRSAQNLLGLIALAKVPEPARPTRKASKRPHQTTAKDATAGEQIVLPALSQHGLPTDGDSHAIAQYYGVLHAYGALQKFFSQAQKKGAAVSLLCTRVLPLYTQPAPSPLLLATANWLLGQYADELATAGQGAGLAADSLRSRVYDHLLRALAFPDGEELEGGPVRASAAGALQALLQAAFFPPEWLPLLQAAVAASHAPEDDEVARAFQLLQTAAETENDEVARHVPELLPVLTSSVVERLPEERSGPWPAVAESGLAAMTQLVTLFDEAGESGDTEEDEQQEGDEERDAPYLPSPADQQRVADCVAAFLHRAWRAAPADEEAAFELPSDSGLHDASILFVSLLKRSNDRSSVERCHVSALLAVWCGLLREWDAWGTEEDSAALSVVDAAIEKQKSCLLPHFVTCPTPPPPLPPVPPQSPLEAIAAFLADAIETVRADGVWRACLRTHALVHATAMAFEGHEAAKAVVHRLATACASRLQQLSSPSAPLSKPLLLAIATCFLANPPVVIPALASALSTEATSDRESLAGLVEWTVRLAALTQREEAGLTDATECHLAAAALVKAVELLMSDGGAKGATGVAGAALEGALRAVERERELRDADSAMEEGGSEAEKDGDEDDNEEDEEEEEEEAEDETEQEESEAAFLARYAAAARELEEGEDDREGGAEEDGQPVELGVLALSSPETAVLGCLKAHGRAIFGSAAIQDQELLNTFSASVPEAASYLRPS